MRRLAWLVLVVLVAAAAWLLVPRTPTPPAVNAVGDPARGEYVLHMAGCLSCHTDAKNGGQPLAGGRALPTDFGTFYSPNITPDPETGIGGWSTEAFVQALTEGLSPSGQHYYPAFPYTAYTRMTEQDLADLKAYLDTVPPVPNQVRPHDLSFPFSFRPLLLGWKMLFFDDGPILPDPNQSESWNRGAYLVNGPGHCGECHTPRNILGGPKPNRRLAGTERGPDGKAVPNITPQEGDGIGGWSATDVTFMLQTGLLPDGDAVGGAMGDVIEDNTSHLTPEDRAAIAEYLLSLPPLPGPPKPSG
jgi:mono/diheme cytochrome c family protein